MFLLMVLPVKPATQKHPVVLLVQMKAESVMLIMKVLSMVQKISAVLRAKMERRRQIPS